MMPSHKNTLFAYDEFFDELTDNKEDIVSWTYIFASLVATDT